MLMVDGLLLLDAPIMLFVNLWEKIFVGKKRERLIGNRWYYYFRLVLNAIGNVIASK